MRNISEAGGIGAIVKVLDHEVVRLSTLTWHTGKYIDVCMKKVQTSVNYHVRETAGVRSDGIEGRQGGRMIFRLTS